MDLENKALKEAFNKKYGGIKTDDEDFKRFAKKYYGEETTAPRREGPSLMERAKETVKGIAEMNAARRAGDIKRLGKAMGSDYRGF